MNPKKTTKKNKKRNNTLKVIGFVCAGVQLILAIVLIVMLAQLDIIPFEFKILIDALLVLFCMVTAITQHWVVPGIITKVLSVFMSIVMGAMSFYMNVTYRTLDKISGSYTKISTMGVYVLGDSSIQDILDLSGAEFGIIARMGREETDSTIYKIEETLTTTIECTEYNSVIELADSLMDGSSDAIIINSNYFGMIEDVEGYNTFKDSIKCVMTYSVETVVEQDKNEQEEVPEQTDDCITIYVSGIDTTGPANVTSNSDVNIICTINTKTHQVLLISTPRDFYVPLSISGDMKDKLTHAGAYGVEVSMDTLELLYDVNIDYYLKVNFTGFVDIVDALGGIEVYSEYDFTAYHGGFHYNAGMNTLNGIQALGFARERYSFAQGDKQRGRNHMEVIKGMINKMTSADMISNYTSVLDAISGSMVTDMPQQEISDLVKLQLEENPKWEILSYSVDGTHGSGYTYSLPNMIVYVMIPMTETVEKAKGYIDLMYSNQKITIE